MAFNVQSLCLWICVLLYSQFSFGTLQTAGTTVYLDDTPYFVRPDEDGVFDIDRSGLRGRGLRPVTVLKSDDHKEASIAAELSKATEKDDVWHAGFLEGESEATCSLLSSDAQDWICVNSIIIFVVKYEQAREPKLTFAKSS